MPKADDILKVARAEIGTKESPSGSNKVKYNTWYYGREVSGSAYPWCAAFTSWVLDKVGITDYKSVSCPVIKSIAQKKGTYHSGSNGIKASDLVLYQFDKDSDPDHIGIVESVSGSSIVAIEGNTSVSSDDNGGCVMRRTRSKGLIMGYVSVCAESIKKCTVELPELKKGCTGNAVRSLQLLLNALNFPCGEVDGILGDNTEKALIAFQEKNGLEADGICGKNTWTKLIGG